MSDVSGGKAGLVPAPADSQVPKAQAPGGADTGAGPDELQAGRDATRRLLARMGAVLGAAATAILGGLGWTRLNDVFPIPKNVSTGSWIGLIVAMTAAVVGSAWLAAIFFAAQRRILIGTTSDSRKGLHGVDIETVDRVLDEHAREESAPKLLDVELRALRFERIARGLRETEQKRADKLQAEADRLYQVVRIALHRASTAVLEDRSRRAFFRWPTFVSLGLAAGGIFATFAIADYYKGQRDLSALRATCAKNERVFLGACAPFEASADRRMRRLVQKAQSAAAAIKSAKAAKPGTLTLAQEKLITAAAACDKAVSKAVSSPTRAEIVGLCAVSTK
jgi:hypothetical protein